MQYIIHDQRLTFFSHTSVEGKVIHMFPDGVQVQPIIFQCHLMIQCVHKLNCGIPQTAICWQRVLCRRLFQIDESDPWIVPPHAKFEVGVNQHGLSVDA